VCVGGREGFEDVQPRVNEQKERSYRWIYYNLCVISNIEKGKIRSINIIC
jgi:hypothetical protein